MIGSLCIVNILIADDLVTHGVNNHGTEIVMLKYSGFSARKVKKLISEVVIMY